MEHTNNARCDECPDCLTKRLDDVFAARDAGFAEGYKSAKEQIFLYLKDIESTFNEMWSKL